MKTLQTGVLIFLWALACSCSHEKAVEPDKSFIVMIHSDDGSPIPNATIRGGIDWEMFAVRTDSQGIARMPAFARKQRATVSADNFIPEVIYELVPDTYTLALTPKTFIEIGEVLGDVIRFGTGEIITVDYQGGYRVYDFDDASVTLRAEATIVSTNRKRIMKHDTLWVSTHDDGIYAYSITDPNQPLQLFRLPVEGYVGPFDVADSLLIVGDRWKPGALQVYSWNNSGSIRMISSIREFITFDVRIIGDAVAILGNASDLPTVFDISDPTSLRLSFRGYNFEYSTGMFIESGVLVKSRTGTALGYFDYQVISMSDPLQPVRLQSFAVEGEVFQMYSNGVAIGSHYFDESSITIFERYGGGRFQPAAILFGGGISGGMPPYFVVRGKLIKVVDREGRHS